MRCGEVWGQGSVGTDGTFTNFPLPKSWKTFRLSPNFVQRLPQCGRFNRLRLLSVRQISGLYRPRAGDVQHETRSEFRFVLSFPRLWASRFHEEVKYIAEVCRSLFVDNGSCASRLDSGLSRDGLSSAKGVALRDCAFSGSAVPDVRTHCTTDRESFEGI